MATTTVIGMPIHVPTTPFANLVGEEGSDRALRMVQGLTEDQCRYALWAVLVLLFGCPDSNATDVVLEAEVANGPKLARRVSEGQLVLAQIGTGRSQPATLGRLEKRTARLLAEE